MPTVFIHRLSDHCFGTRIEKVQAFRVQRQAEPVVHVDADARVDRGYHCVLTDRHIEEDLGAELLDNLDRRVETELGRVGR